MEKLITAFPQNLKDALVIASEQKFQHPKQDIRNCLILGMGGSGIGGKMVSFWAMEEMSIPVQSCHDYNIPNYVNQHTLIIASSYSGNTEETLMALETAISKGAHVIGVCSGGDLQALCEEKGYDCVVVPGGNPPRTALGFSIVQVTNIFVQLGFLDASILKQFAVSADFILEHKSAIQVEAQKLADFLNGKIPIFYSAAKYEGIAVRARQQFNENSKMLCWHHVIPEMNHNELVGWGGGDDRFAVVFFDTHDLIRRNQKRLELTLDIIRKKATVLVLDAKGNSFIERSIYLIHLVDWASLYMASYTKADSMEIKVIDYLKNELSNFN